MIFQTEKQLKEYGEKISADKKQPIEDALAELKKAHEAQDIAQVDAAMEKINNAWNATSQELYAAMNENGGAQAGPTPDAGAGNAQNAGGDDVEDVDFEEVK